MVYSLLEKLNPDVLIFTEPKFLLTDHKSSNFKEAIMFSNKYGKPVFLDDSNDTQFRKTISKFLDGLNYTYLNEENLFDGSYDEEITEAYLEYQTAAHIEAYQNLSNFPASKLRILLGGAHVNILEKENGKIKAGSCVPYTAKLIFDYLNKDKEVFMIEDLILGDIEKGIYKVNGVSEGSVLKTYCAPYIFCSKLENN